MKFARFPLADAAGVILAHTQRLPGGAIKKGTMLGGKELAALAAAGVNAVVGARLDPDDLDEDAVAAAVGAALAGPGLEAEKARTGRCNLVAVAAGLVRLDAARVEALNLVDDAITVATLGDLDRADAGQVVITVKIIPFAVPRERVERLLATLEGQPAPVAVTPFRPRRVALLQTRLDGTREEVLDKAVRVTAERVESLGGRIERVDRIAHEAGAVATALRAARHAGCDLLLVSGATVTTDPGDAVPAGLVAAGGEVDHFGLPVEPGNMLMFGRLGDVPVIDLPGCGRSPKLNGLDWVLERTVAGIAVDRAAIARMAVGGLIKDLPTPVRNLRQAPHCPGPVGKRLVAAAVFAAGSSRRMGGENKLLLEVDGRPLVAHAVEAATHAGLDPVLVVTGADADAVEAALAGYPVTFVHNPDHAEGMSTSLRAALDALPDEVDGVSFLLGDMPAVSALHLRLLVEAFAPEEGRGIVVPTFGGRRGNPIVWSRRLFAAMREVTGDKGARDLLETHGDEIHLLAMPDDAVLVDIDSPEALVEYRER